MAKKIPVVYAYVYYRLKKDTKTEHIHLTYIKEIVGRTLVRHGGFPNFLVKYVIRDLVDVNLLERVNKSYYKIVESDCDKKICQMFPFF